MPTRDLTDNFDFQLIEEFGGYNSARDKTTLKPNILIRGSKNVYKKVSGTIASREGLKRRGAADSTDAGVKASFEWETSKGTTRPLRVCNSKLEVESDIVTSGTYLWYELFETGAITTSLAATLTRWVFDSWWHTDEKKDRLIAVRGDDKIFHWSGGMALVDSATTNTITKTGTQTWAEAGFATQIAGEKKIIINGVEYTYTGGETTTTLTGVTPDASGLTTNSVAIQSIIVQDNAPVDGFASDFLKTVGNQVHVGSYTSRTIYQSADIADGGGLVPLDFANSGSHVFGDPDTITLDNHGKGIGTQDGKVYIFAGDSDLYEVTPNVNVTYTFTGSDSLSRFAYNKVDKKKLPGLNGALGHEFIDNFGSDLIWLDQKNQLRSLATIANVDRPIPIHLSLPVKDELSDDDFTGGHLRSIGDTIHITAPNNGRDWMFTIRETLTDQGAISYEKIWHPPQIRGISRFSIIGGVVYGHSNVNPQLYQVFNTNQWYDDNPTDEPIPYTSVARFAYRNGGKRNQMIAFDKYYFEGYMPNGVELLLNIYLDYQGAEMLLSQVINQDEDLAKFWLGTPYPSFGDASFGDNPLGDGIIPEGGEQETVPKFRRIVDVTVGNHFEHSIEVYSTSADSRWELLALGPNMVLSGQHPTFIR